MKLDTRRPLLVLVGAWNPAIFNPNWVALNLLDYPLGSTVQFAVVQMEQSSVPVTYIDQLGYLATSNRLELYAQTHSEAGLTLISDIVKKITSTLPHTPLGNFGINFRFIEDDPSPEIYDALHSTDNIHHHFRIISQDFTAKIAFRDGCDLNFKRVPTEEQVLFEFNYHHYLSDDQPLGIIKPDYLQSLLAESSSILKMLYGIEEYEELAHTFDSTDAKGEGS